MGIKGIYGEIGPGQRIALSRLAVEKFEQTGRPLRIAIDISIWQFQVQSGKGGSNPALRTLYYRLIRLLSCSIQPLFVFDGPNKPPFKRNVRTNPHTVSLPNFLAKQMLDLFGFPYYSAPGEAEAECALLQKESIVDAVLSEDVDTLMFGCGLSMRNWSSEGTRANKSPTHVNVYKSEATKQGKAELDPAGMILIALMSGGDYTPAGIPGCGIKIACEAARAGLGKDLCCLSRKDMVGLRQWRERLEYELRANESGYFRTKHKALKVPENFPDKAVLGYYTHPVVSSAEKLLQLKQEINWDADVDVGGLRHFVAEAFGWQNLSGAKKFIRGLAPAMLVHRLRRRGGSGLSRSDNLETQEKEEASIVAAVCGRRIHFITDGTPELRLAYIPVDLVGLDLEKEEPEAVGLDDCNDSEIEPSASGDEERDRSMSPIKSRSTSPITKRGASTYNPTRPEKLWVLETYAKIGVPLTVETWEENMRDPKKFASRKARERSAIAKGGMKKGALDAFVKVTKPGIPRMDKVTANRPNDFGRSEIPPVLLAPVVAAIPISSSKSRVCGSSKPQVAPSNINTPPKKPRTKPKSVHEPATVQSPKDNTINPWSLARRPSDTMNVRLRRSARYSALGIYGHSGSAAEDSSPLSNPTDSGRRDGLGSTPVSPTTPCKHNRSSSPRCETDKVRSTLEATTEHQPSPRKRYTPTKAQNSHDIENTPTTPTSPANIHVDAPDLPNPLSPPTSQRVNRRLEFSSAASVQTSPASIPSSLPSPSTFMSPPPHKSTSVRQTTTHGLLPIRLKPGSPSKSARGKRMLVVRGSLDGAWKEVEAWEVAGDTRNRGRGVYRKSAVEVLDMTTGSPFG
ncbi:hypothetical protein MMC08_003684 [Hypocenomyce scalaris]|nr:hypothetical protein [Hypocenomyce scalaris]